MENKQLVIDATLEFLVTAVTSTKAGLVFHDPTYGTSGSNQNHLLFNLISNITEPWTRPNLAKVVIAALGACSDLIRPYFIKVRVKFLFLLSSHLKNIFYLYFFDLLKLIFKWYYMSYSFWPSFKMIGKTLLFLLIINFWVSLIFHARFTYKKVLVDISHFISWNIFVNIRGKITNKNKRWKFWNLKFNNFSNINSKTNFICSFNILIGSLKMKASWKISFIRKVPVKWC